MAYLLRFDGVDDVVILDSPIASLNVGGGYYRFRVVFKMNALPASGIVGIIGTTAASTSSGLVVASDGSLRIYSAGTSRYQSAAGFIVTGVDYDVTVEHQTDGSWVITNNLTSSTVTSGTFTTSTVFGALGQFGRSSTSSANYLSADVKRIEIQTASLNYSWDPSLSNGTGVKLFSSPNVNDGTLNNFVNPWVLYGTSSLDITLNTIGSTANVRTPTVTKDKLITLPVIPAGTLVRTPSVTKEKRITLPLINSTASVRVPSVGVQGSKTIGLSFIDTTATVRVPKIVKDKLIQLQHKYNTSVVHEPEVKRDKLIVLEMIASLEQMYSPEVLGGYRPLPDITLFPAEGYGLHIRSAEELMELVVALAKRVEILEKKDIV